MNGADITRYRGSPAWRWSNSGWTDRSRSSRAPGREWGRHRPGAGRGGRHCRRDRAHRGRYRRHDRGHRGGGRQGPGAGGRCDEPPGRRARGQHRHGASRPHRHPGQQRRRLQLCTVSGHHRRGLPAHLRLVRDLGVHHEPARGRAHARRRERLDRQHLVGLGPVRDPGIDRLLRREGRPRGAHPRHGAGTRAQGPGQRHCAGLFRHRRSAGQPGPDARIAGEDAGGHAPAPAGRRRGPRPAHGVPVHRDCYATNAIFHVDGGLDSNNSPLPIPDY